MLNIIIRFCVKEPWLVVLLAIGCTIGGWFAYKAVPIDAIPNVGENQVIVLTPWPGRSPKDIEDQVTYPLSVSLSAVPGAESVRGKSMFGYSFVQVTFKDEIDFYWAHSRVSEQLGSAASQLPDEVVPQLGPDATGLGQVYYYTLQPPAAGMGLAELRSMQDFVVKYELQAVEGVSEVASIGGYVRQYQIEVDPDKLRFHNVALDALVKAIKGSNLDVGAKTVETTGMEYIVRGKGFLGSDGDQAKAIRDIEDTVIMQRDGVPVRVSDVAKIQLGPDFRRGALDYNGAEAVGGVVVMRYGENPRVVIDRVKEKIAQIEPALKGVRIHGVYDRSGLIDETMATLTHALRDEILITAVIILLFLLHIRSSFVVAICLPSAVLISFIAMHFVGVGSNIMSLAGIAIAIGTMVDMGIIVSENIYQHLADWEKEESEGEKERESEKRKPRADVVYDAAIEVAPAVVTAVATTIVSFLPVFFLTGRDYRLFSPLAYTKTFAIAAAMLTAVTIVPALSRLMLRSANYRRRTALVTGIALAALVATACHVLWGPRLADFLAVPHWLVTVMTGAFGFVAGWQLMRERIRPIEEIPSSRFVRWIYAARLRHALNHKAFALSFPAILLVVGVGAYFGMPTVLQPVEKTAKFFGADLNEFPGYVDAKHVFTGLQSDDWIALDEGSWFYMPTLYPAASFSQAMEVLQTQDVLIGQIPEVKDVLGKIGRVESALDPAPAAMVETYVMLRPESEWRGGVTARDVWDEINKVATLPGVTPASALQPIEGRVVMLQSGIKAPMAIRVYGDDLQTLADAAMDVAATLKESPYINAGTVNPDIVLGKPYVRTQAPILSALVAMACAASANAQTHQHDHTAAGHNHASPSAQVANGPHGGSLRQTDGIQLETVVSQAGIQMFVFDRAGQPVSVDNGRGAASLRVSGNAKRYRYDLLPDGKGGLTAPVNLSAIAGRQIEVDIQLVGIPATRGRTVSFQEVASVPASEQQLAAAAIARQKICPVSGKPLGSMGDPVAVDVNGQRLFVCCAGCVNAVKANPAKYAAGRPDITVSSATQADAALIARQKVCPVMDEPLGGMGNPIKVMVGDKPIFLCCKGCVKKIQAEPAKYLAMVYGNQTAPQTPAQADASVVPAGVEPVRPGVFNVTAADALFIAAQKRCPVMDEPLDAMGGPFKVDAAGKAIYICCPGCAKKIAAEPQKYLDILAKQGVKAPILQPQSRASVVPAGVEQVREGVFKVTAADAPFIAAQKRCPVMDEPLDAMGGPYKVNAAGKAIYICCPGCAKKIATEPQKYLGILAKQGVNAPILR